MIPQNKQQLVDAIHSAYTKLRQDLEDIPPALVLKKDLVGHAKGTQMSVKDLIAYLVGWGELVLKWKEKIDNAEEVDFPETGYQWNELGLLAQKFYQDYSILSYPQLLSRFDQTVARILQMIELENDQTLYTQLWYKHYPMGRMIQLNTSSPYKNARARLRKWKRQLKNG